MQRGADKLRARCFMKQHASRDARVPGSLAAQPRPASVAPSAGGTTASRPDRLTPRHSSVSPWGRVDPRDGRTTPPYGVRHLHGRATYRPTLPKKLATRGFFGSIFLNYASPGLGTLGAIGCHSETRWDATPPLNKGTHKLHDSRNLTPERALESTCTAHTPATRHMAARRSCAN